MSYRIDRNIRLELIAATTNTLSTYEGYLLDQVGWRELAMTMTRLRKAMKEAEALEKRQIEPDTDYKNQI